MFATNDSSLDYSLGIIRHFIVFCVGILATVSISFNRSQAQDNVNNGGTVVAKSESICLVLFDQDGSRTVVSFFSGSGSWTSTEIPKNGRVIAKASERFAIVECGEFLSVLDATTSKWVQAPFKAASPQIFLEGTYVLVKNKIVWAFSSTTNAWSSMDSLDNAVLSNQKLFQRQLETLRDQPLSLLATIEQRSQLERIAKLPDSNFEGNLTETLPADIAAIGLSSFPSEIRRNVQDVPIPIRPGRNFLAIESGEFDSYENADEMRSSARKIFGDFERVPGVAERARFSDAFRGTSRKASKTSIASVLVEEFSTLDVFAASLIEDELMQEREPPIARGPGSRRVDEELRNVRVNAYILAASREEDNDYHVILGNSSDSPDLFFNVEISGLPSSGPSLATLSAARLHFKEFFAGDIPGLSYKFYEPPIPVTVTGSLFFDIDHPGGSVGPARFRPPSAWEIHPITNIEFDE